MTKIIDFKTLLLADEDLLKLCIQESYSGSGPGGQHKNRHKTAQRLTLRHTQISGESCEAREGGINKKKALIKLRLNLAIILAQQKEVIETPIHITKRKVTKISLENPDYPIFISWLWQKLLESDGHVPTVAKIINWSTSSLMKQIFKDTHLWQELNYLREKAGLNRFKAPK
jgi:hypothetical protein